MEYEKEACKNILYINYGEEPTNFYFKFNDCPGYNLIFKSRIENLSLESYDAYIIDLFIYF